MSDEPNGPGADGDAAPSRPATAKERASAYRKAAYQKAKAAHKERQAAQRQSPAGLERKAKERALRQANYRKAKAAHKARHVSDEEAKLRERDEAAAAREAELLEQLLTADQLPRQPPRLTLVPR